MAPVGISALPAGEVSAQPPTGENAWAECLRDLKRTLEGGRVFVLGRGRRYALRDPSKAVGDISREACGEAFDELSRAISRELSAQASAQRAPAPEADLAHKAHFDDSAGGCVRLGDDAAATPPQADEADRGRLEQLTRRVAANISVAPGIQAVLFHDLPPALWQPTFVVCVGQDQVRVMTLAFVGEPVAGDRPSCKRTPYLLKVLTADLAADAAPPPSKYAVCMADEAVESTLGHLHRLEPCVLAAAAVGRWEGVEGMNMVLRNTTQEARIAASRAQARMTDKDKADGGERRQRHPPPSPVQGCRQVGDRAARMRANFEQRAQSPAVGGPSAPAPRAPRGGSCSYPASRGMPPAEATAAGVSVLADGFSVRSVAGAWNSVAASATGALGGLFGRAVSPAAAPERRPGATPVRGWAGAAAQPARPATVVDRASRIRANCGAAQSPPPATGGARVPPHVATGRARTAPTVGAEMPGRGAAMTAGGP